MTTVVICEYNEKKNELYFRLEMFMGTGVYIYAIILRLRLNIPHTLSETRTKHSWNGIFNNPIMKPTRAAASHTPSSKRRNTRRRSRRNIHKQTTHRKTNTPHPTKFHQNRTSDAVVVALIHVPKTAGTAIKSLLRKYTNTHPFVETGTNQDRSSCQRQKKGQDNEGWWFTSADGTPVHIISWGHQPASTFSKHYQNSRIFKVATIREPVDRFISAYNFVREGGRNHPNQGAVSQARQWEPFLKQYESFEAFFRDKNAVRTIMQSAPKGHTHFGPLAPWICQRGNSNMNKKSNGSVDVDYTIRQSHVHEDLMGLIKLLKLPEDVVGDFVPKCNVTGETDVVSASVQKNVANVFRKDIDLYKHLIRPSIRTRMYKEAKEKVDRLFQDVRNNKKKISLYTTKNTQKKRNQ